MNNTHEFQISSKKKTLFVESGSTSSVLEKLNLCITNEAGENISSMYPRLSVAVYHVTRTLRTIQKKPNKKDGVKAV